MDTAVSSSGVNITTPSVDELADLIERQHQLKTLTAEERITAAAILAIDLASHRKRYDDFYRLRRSADHHE